MIDSDKYSKYKKQISRILTPVLWCIFLTWFLFRINKGIDVTDQAYVLTKYKYFFSETAHLTTLGTFLTDLVGGTLFRLAKSHQAIVLSLASWALYMISGIAVYKTFKDRISKNLLLCIIIMCSFFSVSFVHIINYNATSMFMQTLGICLILKAIKNNSPASMILAGLVIGINTLFRLPNILEVAFGIVIIWDSYLKKEKAGEILKKCFAYAAGIFAGWGITLSLAARYLGFSEIKNSIIKTQGTLSNSASSHSWLGMFEINSRGFLNGIKLDFIFLIPIALIAFAAFKLIQKYGSGKKYQIMAAAHLISAMYAAAFSAIVSSRYGMFCMTYVMLVMVMAAGVIYYRKEDPLFSVISLIVLIAEIILVIGTNNGLVYQITFMILPLAAIPVVISAIRHDTVKNVAMLMMTAFLTMIFVYASIYAKDYVYRDEPNEMLTHRISSGVYEGMRTSEDRAAVIKELEEKLGDIPDNKYMISVGGGFNLPYVISDKEPLIESFWIELPDHPKELLRMEIEDAAAKKGLPVVLICKRDKNFNKKKNVTAYEQEKIDIILQFVKRNKYRKDYENGKYVLYIPAE